MDVIDQYNPDFIYTDGNSTQPFSGDHSGSGFKCDAAPRVVAHFYNHTLAKHGKVDTFSIIKFHPPCPGIVNTQEGTFPGTVKTDQPWIGENAVGDWFYAPDFTYDAGAVIRCLLEYVSRDGNYAVCVSLQPDGSLDAGGKQMLQEIGDWLRVNGEGIYGSKGWVKFGEDQDARLESLEVGADRPGQVERAIEDAVRPEALAGKLLAGAGGGGDDEAEAGKGAVQLAHQPADGEDFPNRDGMEPEDGLLAGLRNEPGGDAAEAGEEAVTVLVGGGHLPQPPRRKDHQGQCQCEVVEEENHA